MTDRILKRQDVNGNYDYVWFAIGPSTYRARALGNDVWDIQRVFKTTPSVAVASATYNRLRDIMRGLLEADELQVMRNAS
jgi:hypothetical protein